MAATVSDLSLSFLDDLQPDFRDEDIEHAWCGQIFPLVRTDDFEANWQVVADPEGLFTTPTGQRCRVEPQSHHAARLQVSILDNGTSKRQTATYEAIVFAKLAYRLSLKDRDMPFEIPRRRFVNLVATKFPSKWRDLLIQCDLHLYDEKSFRNASVVEPGIYSPLTSPQNIRLLRILPSRESHAPIQCELRETNFSSAPEYEALSYVWGKGSSRRTVELDGKSFSVGENLEAALRQLRPRKEPRTIWIDAVCINQDDLEERAQQVVQMDMIYKNASSVVVWLGPETDSTTEIFDELEASANIVKSHEDVFYSPYFFNFAFQQEPYCAECEGVPRTPLPAHLVGTCVSERDAEAYARACRNPHVSPDQWINMLINKIESLNVLLARPWWRRVWVLQEVILAKKITIRCGLRSVDWRLFQIFVFTIVRQAKRSRIHHIGGLSYRAREAKAQMQLLMSVNSAFVFFFMQRASQSAQNLSTLSMTDLLSFTAHFDATDPRDRLFSLLSLLPEDSSERAVFHPDYVINARRLYIRTARHFLTTSRSLAVVTARPLPPEYVPTLTPPPLRDPELPSWVPNWEAIQAWMVNSIWLNEFSLFKTKCLSRQAQNVSEQGADGAQSDATQASTEPDTITGKDIQVYNASLGETSPFPFTFSAWDEVLHVRGETIDVIQEVGPAWYLSVTAIRARTEGDPEGSRKRAHDAQVAIIERWKEIARLSEEGPYPFTNQSRREAFWRTIFMDRYRSNINAENFHIKRLPSILSKTNIAEVFNPWGVECSFPPEGHDEEISLIWYLRHEVTEMWSFANVNLHCADLKFFRTEKGYIGLCHPKAKHGDLAVVLLGASVPLILREHPEGYTIVGQSYIHGVMDGELIQAKRDEGKGSNEEDFRVFDIV